MTKLNETSHLVCKFLTDESFSLIYRKFVEGFSDYLAPFQLTEQQFRNHILLNAVDLNRSVGCYDGEELIGISLNGFGKWLGVPTVYDAGTAVLPAHRRRGVSELIFKTMLPIFKRAGYEQCLLEVLVNNHAAVRLYEKLGFQRTRNLYVLQASELKTTSDVDAGVELRDLDAAALPPHDSLGGGRPSWQNSAEAIERTVEIKRAVGAFEAGECVGYIVFSVGFGRVSQIAVRPDRRGRGIASRLLAAMRDETGTNPPLQVINIDAGLSATIDFFRKRGFEVHLEQFEMLKRL